MAERWAPLDARLQEQLGDTWAMWGHGAHLHDGGEEVVVALAPHAVGYVQRHLGGVIGEASSVPVRLVGCGAVG